MIKDREIITESSERLVELWNDVYHLGNTGELNNETYTSIKIINTSDKSDGPSWDYILERKSDSKFFKLSIWDAGYHNGFLCEDECIEEVFKEEKLKIIYK